MMTRAVPTPLFALALLLTTVSTTQERVLAAGRPVVFQSADGTPLAGSLFEASNRPAPGVVLVHMLGRSKEEWTPLAERLQDAGITALAVDLRGHGSSGGSAVTLPPLIGDVRAAIEWLGGRANTRPGSLAVVGSSLGANLAALAAADSGSIRAVGLVSPSLDYRGIRLDAAVMKRLGDRPVWLAASTEDPYALRTVRELIGTGGAREQQLSSARAHGTNLLINDPDLSRALVDWLKRTLIS